MSPLFRRLSFALLVAAGSPGCVQTGLAQAGEARPRPGFEDLVVELPPLKPIGRKAESEAPAPKTAADAAPADPVPVTPGTPPSLGETPRAKADADGVVGPLNDSIAGASAPAQDDAAAKRPAPPEKAAARADNRREPPAEANRRNAPAAETPSGAEAKNEAAPVAGSGVSAGAPKGESMHPSVAAEETPPAPQTPAPQMGEAAFAPPAGSQAAAPEARPRAETEAASPAPQPAEKPGAEAPMRPSVAAEDTPPAPVEAAPAQPAGKPAAAPEARPGAATQGAPPVARGREGAPAPQLEESLVDTILSMLLDNLEIVLGLVVLGLAYVVVRRRRAAAAKGDGSSAQDAPAEQSLLKSWLAKLPSRPAVPVQPESGGAAKGLSALAARAAGLIRSFRDKAGARKAAAGAAESPPGPAARAPAANAPQASGGAADDDLGLVEPGSPSALVASVRKRLNAANEPSREA